MSGRRMEEGGGVWTASAMASVGLGVAGADANGRFGAAPTFFKANFSLERVLPLGSSFAVIARATGQATSGTVPASEVFTFGGRDYGRASVVAETFGDRGAAVMAELRYQLDWLGGRRPPGAGLPEVHRRARVLRRASARRRCTTTGRGASISGWARFSSRAMICSVVQSGGVPCVWPSASLLPSVSSP